MRGAAGFATPTALGLLAVIGLLGVSALQDALFGEQLAGSRLLHQRAAALAQLGLQAGMARIGALPSPASETFSLQPLQDSSDNVSVTLRHMGSSPLPPGFSSERFAAQHFEIESTGFTARGIRSTQVQGAVRIMPVVLAVPP